MEATFFGLGLRAKGSGLRVWGLGFRAYGLKQHAV